MSTFQIRLIAIITMIIDHVGLFFFPDIAILRVIGRISFPLFAWLIVNGLYYTHDSKKYLTRLFILACVSQLPFILSHHAIGYPYWFFNVVFTLSLGLATITIIKNVHDLYLKIGVVAITVLISFLFNFDYGVVGILSIVCFYIFSHSPTRLALSQVLVFSIPVIFKTVISIYHNSPPSLTLSDFNPLIGVFISLLCIYFYNNKEGLKAKYLFYFFYPMQYIIIFIILSLYYR